MPDRSLRQRLQRHHEALRRAHVLHLALRAAAAASAAVALAFLLGMALPLSPATAWARLALLGLGLVAALGWAVREIVRRVPAFDAYLERAELRFPGIRSWLRNALDLEANPPTTTSAALAHALVDETARRLESVPLATLAPRLAPARPLLSLALALAAIAGAGAIAPDGAARAWRTLWRPALAAPPVRLVVEPGSVTITPGASLAVRARVWGSGQAPRLLRDGHAAITAVDEGHESGGERRWRFDLQQLTRAEDYRVRVASVESPRYRIALDGTPTPLSFEIAVRAPAYARLPVQRGASTRGDLSALAGSVATVDVTFDRDLQSLEATLPGGARATFSPLSPRRWRGEVAIRREGTWEMRSRTAGGEGRDRYAIRPVPDAAPVLAVRIPEGDVDLPAGQLIPMALLAQDDLGLARLSLEVRRSADEPWHAAPLRAFEGQPREADVASRWDASGLGLLPGETASFRFVVEDNNVVSGPGRAVSPTFELRFPSLADLYEKTDRTQAGVQNTLEKSLERAKELEKSLERLERQQAIRAPQTSASAFERSEELKRSLEQQKEVSRQLDEAAKNLRESLEQAAERRAFDEQLMRKMKEMSELLQQIQSPELRKAMEKMQKALENLDRRALEQNLPQWRQENKDLLANLERSIELLKRLREEEQLAALSQRAEELKQRQDEMNRHHDDAADHPPRDARSAAKESQSRAEQQQRAAEDSERLAEEARQMAESLENPEEKQTLEQAADEVGKQAAEAQEQASSEAQQQQNREASRSGKRASKSLGSAAQRMSQMAQQRQKEREGADVAAVRRAAQDLVSIERSNADNMESPSAPSQRSDRQTDLAEGLSRVADSLATLAKQTPFLSPSVTQGLGRAMQNLQSSGRDLAAGNRQRGEDAARAAGEALNGVVLELRNTESSMCSTPGNTPGQKPSPGQQMSELSDQQSQLNQQTRSIARRLSEQIEMQAGQPEELQRLAAEQARIREQVEQLAREDESQNKLLGRLDQAQREMEEAEEALREGRADADLEEKQARILSRMLDAQRSIHRRDFDPERESRPGEELARTSPAELPADLLRSSDRLRLGLLKAEADRYPSQYRAFIESYLRSLTEGKR